MTTSTGRLLVAAILASTCVAALVAQGTNRSDGGSLAELTAEIRLLRAAVEQSTRAQTQSHALGIFLSAQQSRILQVSDRLDASRVELNRATRDARSLVQELAAVEVHLQRVQDQAERLAIEDRQRALKREIEAAGAQEQQARVREGEFAEALQIEQARWTDLISRLQQIVDSPEGRR